MSKKNVIKLCRMKEEGTPIAALTCYSYSMARIIAKCDVDMVLVGDSVGMVELGYENTIPVTVEDMIHHTKAVKKAAPDAMIVTDMPFLSFNLNKEKALENAGRLFSEAGAEAVKIEGGGPVCDKVRFITENNIPVMGHLGLTPQSVHKMGGYRVQGRAEKQAEKIMKDARMLEEAGVFSVVLEGIPQELAKKITESLSVPTIGIGAGAGCDGQILVLNDMLGLNLDFKPRFVRRYARLEREITGAVEGYVKDVRERKFPSEDEAY